MKYKFVNEKDMVDGMPTLGVVYHMLRERDIREAFAALGIIAPQVYGYLVEEEGDEE